jgi:electron transport complex protein RnfB
MSSFLNVLFAILVLGALGVLFGAALAYAGKVFAPEKNPNLDKIIEVLPGANCGACGFAGCSAYAEALAEGGADVNLCPVGGEAATAKIAEILGVELKKNVRLTALVRCNGGNRSKNKYNYKGIKDCHAASLVAGGHLMCAFGCLGFGSCVAACKFGAISVKDGVAVVDHEKCTGCLKCVETCPRGIIVPVPYTTDVNVVCSSHEKGALLRKICEIGCIGCKICEKTCKYDAIHVEDNLASIDYEKCTGCGECAVKCPRHLIVDSKLLDPSSEQTGA